MKTPRTQLSRLLASRFAEVKRPGDLAKQIAAYLITERRIGELASLMRDMQVVRLDEGIVEVTATSAYPLSEAARRDVESEVRALYPSIKHVTIEEHPDPAVISGVRLDTVDKRYDMTAKNKLQKFKTLAVHRKEYA